MVLNNGTKNVDENTKINRKIITDITTYIIMLTFYIYISMYKYNNISDNYRATIAFIRYSLYANMKIVLAINV